MTLGARNPCEGDRSRSLREGGSLGSIRFTYLYNELLDKGENCERWTSRDVAGLEACRLQAESGGKPSGVDRKYQHHVNPITDYLAQVP